MDRVQRNLKVSSGNNQLELTSLLEHLFSCFHQILLITFLNKPKLFFAQLSDFKWKRVLHIPQSDSITGTSPLECLMSYPGHSLEAFYLCRDAVGVFYGPSSLFEIKAKCLLLSISSFLCLVMFIIKDSVNFYDIIPYQIYG